MEKSESSCIADKDVNGTTTAVNSVTVPLNYTQVYHVTQQIHLRRWGSNIPAHLCSQQLYSQSPKGKATQMPTSEQRESQNVVCPYNGAHSSIPEYSHKRGNSDTQSKREETCRRQAEVTEARHKKTHTAGLLFHQPPEQLDSPRQGAVQLPGAAGRWGTQPSRGDQVSV